MIFLVDFCKKFGAKAIESKNRFNVFFKIKYYFCAIFALFFMQFMPAFSEEQPPLQIPLQEETQEFSQEISEDLMRILDQVINQDLDIQSIEQPQIQEPQIEQKTQNSFIKSIEIIESEQKNSQNTQDSMQNIGSIHSNEQNTSLIDSIKNDNLPQVDKTTKTAETPSFAKRVYVEVSELDKSIYFRQIVPYTLRVLVLAEFKAISTDFEFIDDSVALLNPHERWELLEDGSLQNTFYFKINSKNFTLPKIKITANTDEGVFSESVSEISKQSIDLGKNDNFSGLLAENLHILDTKITSFDSENNLLVAKLSTQMGEISDFKLDFAQSGIESSSGDFKQSIAYYYAIVPKSLSRVEFSYFNTQDSRFLELFIENIAKDERISTQSDIKPKQTEQFFWIALCACGVIFFVLAFFYQRKIVFIILALACVGLLVYFLLGNAKGVIKADSIVRILPITNSTQILQLKEPQSAEILGKRGDFVKVLFDYNGEQIGWVKKEDIK